MNSGDMGLDHEFWEEARTKPAPCWGVGKEGEPCEHCQKRRRGRKGRIGCGAECGCGCSSRSATMGLHTQKERDGAYDLAIKAYHHARTSDTPEARAWALGYLQAIADLAMQENTPGLAKDVEVIANRLK